MPLVSPSDLDPCPGVLVWSADRRSSAPVPCGSQQQPQVRGHDGRFRCLRCHALHDAQAEREAGSSPILPSLESKPKPVRDGRATVEQARRDRVIKIYGDRLR
jgi:hypothetical protein